jgi:hypothetical protein
MKIESIPLYDQLPLGGATQLIDISHEDLTQATAGAAQTLSFVLAAGEVFGVMAIRLVEAFEHSTDAAFNTTVMKIGNDPTPERYLTATELNAKGAKVTYKQGVSAEPGLVSDAANEVRIRFEGMTGKSLSNLNKGRVLIYGRRISLKEFGPYS